VKSPYFFALDVDDPHHAIQLAKQTCSSVGGFKLGPRLVLRAGSEFVRDIATLAPVFLDFKFFDIPSTMTAAIRACFEMNVSFATVHAACGTETLAELSQLEKSLNAIRPFRILAVTVLTSMRSESMPSFTSQVPISNQVLELAKMVFDSGLRGIVCSPHEIEAVHRLCSDSFIVAPGIRTADEPSGDQKRTLAPQEALQLGASALVIGRPILNAANPVAKAQELFAHLRKNADA
jgi:orotidine-5'-phosphate decarboxylase